MSDVNSNININIDASDALTTIKNLQRQISLFHQEMARSGSAANQAAARGLQNTLMQNINATGQFRSQIKTIQSETEHFTEQLEKNKMSIGQYFRYAGASTKSFGKLWKSEFQTIEKVAVERVKTLQTQYIKLGRDANGALKSIAVRPLALDMNNFATKAAVAAQKQALLNQLLKQGSTAMLNWGKNTQWAGRQLMVGFTVPLAMAGTAAAQAYIDFEKAAIKFKRVYGDFNTSADATNKMADSVKKLALEYTKYGVAVTDTMNMAADAAAMGKTGTDLLQQVQQANKLAVLGNVSQAQALETTISLTNAFGISADKLSTKINFLNAVENQTVTSIEDLTIAVPKAAPVIQQLGGDVEDLAYFLTAMKEGGIDASEGANALKSGLASIINPTKQAQDMLNGFGISITNIRDAHAGDVSGMLKDLATQLNGLSSLDRARAIEQTFGKFQFARMSTLFQNITKEGSQANQVLELQKMNATELAIMSERELKKVENSPAYKFQKVLADIQAKLIPIGEAFLKAITPIIEKVGGILDGFNNMGEGAKQFATLATIAIAGIGPVALMAFGLIANGVANLIKMFAGLKSFFNGTKGGAQDLGDATQYMTQKELEATAVASSLEQGHAKLTQQFTAQTQAIQNLIAEYELAISAQGRMLAGMGSVGANTPGFSTGGTVQGPSGNDNLTIKATAGEEMLTQGQVSKGSAIMGSIIDKLPERFSADIDTPGARRRKSLRGNIESLDSQGFGNEAMQAIKEVEALGGTANQASQILRNLSDAAKGGPEAVKQWMASLTESTTEASSASNLINIQKTKTGAGVSKSTTNFTHVGSGIEMPLDEAERRGLLVGSGNEKYANEQLQQWRDGGSQGQAPKFAVKSMFGMGNFDKNVNRAMAAEGADVKDFNAAFDVAGVEKWNDSVVAGGGNLKELALDLDAFDAKIKQIIADSGATKVFDTRDQAQAFGKGGIALEDVVSQARAEASPKLQTAIDKAAGTARETRVGASGQPVSGRFNQEEISKDLSAQFNKEMKKVGQDAGQGLIDGAEDTLDINSPSRRMWEIGKDAAEGLMNGAKETFGKMKGVATDVAGKGADLVAKGYDAGKAKVTAAAQSYVDNWNAGIDREVAARQEKGQKQMQLASQILEATDAEYVAIKAEQDAYQEKLRSTNQATEQEVQAAIAREQVLRQKREGVAQEIENSGQDLRVIEKRLQNAEKADQVNDIEASNAQQDAGTLQQRQKNLIGGEGAEPVANPMTYGQFRQDTKGMTKAERKNYYNNLNKADRKSVRGGTFKAVGGGMQKAAMVGTMVAGAASMMPGPVGKAAQDATPLIGSLSMLSGLITGPVSGALVALVAVVGGIMFAINKLDEAFKQSAQKQMEIADKLGASEAAINGFAEATGSVTGSQYMEKLNATKAQSLFETPGKTTFGKNFMEGDMGKGMLAAAKTSLASSGGDNKAVIANLTQQLSSAVISGALSKNQAASIASRLAYELGDMDIAFKVQAQVTDIVGPDGKSFQDNPAKIAAKLYEQNASDTKALMGAPKGQVWSGGENNETNRNVTAGGTILAAAGTGAGIGAIAGNLIPIPGVGAAAGAVVGTIIGAIAGTIAAVGTLQADAEKAGKNAGATVANMAHGLELQKQMSDQLDAYYNKLLEEAKANGDIAEYKRLQVEYDQKKKELGEQNAKAAQVMIDEYKNSADKGALDKGIDAGLEVKMKDNADYAMIKDSLKSQLDAMDDESAYMLKAQIYNGLDFTKASKFLGQNDAGTDTQKEANKKSTNKLIAAGGTRFSDAMNASSAITDQTVRTKFLTDLSGIKDDAEAKKMTDLVMQIQQLGGVMSQSIDQMVNTIISDPEATARIQEMTTELQGTKDQTFEQTITTMYKLNPELDKQDAKDKMQAVNEEYFNSLKDEGQRDTYISTIDTVLEATRSVKTFDDLKSNPDFAKWLTEPENGGQYGGYPGEHSLDWWRNTYAEGKAQEVTKSAAGSFTPADSTPKTTGGGGGSGPEAHWTDDYVKKLRDFSMASQKLTVGIDASTNALKNFKKAGQASFNGLSNQLRAAGASEAMIGHILDDDAKNIAKFFKNGKLTAAGLKVQARIYQATIAEYVDKQRSAAEVSRDTATAMRKLTAAGMSYVAASEAVGDAELAQAIAHASNTAEVKALIAAYKQAQVEAYKVNEATEEGRAKNSMDLAEAHTKALEATSQKYQTGLDVIASKEQDINKTYEKRMKALDKVLQVNQDIAASQQDQLTMADALSKGDIFAAAKAMSDQKAKDAQKQGEAQKQALTDAKDAQVAGLTATVDGKQMTREQLEEKIKDINDQILVIKQKEIDKQNELIARKEYEAKLDIAKQARGAAATSTSTGGGNPSGGSGTGTGTNSGPAKPAVTKPTVVKPPVSNLTKSKEDGKTIAASYAASKKSRDKATDSFLKNQYQRAMDIQIDKARKLVSKTRQENSFMARFSDKDVASQIGINFLAGGKSPKRMGLMKHPMARGMDVMPSMVGLNEFMMSAGAVRKYGRDTMLKMNSGMLDMEKKKSMESGGSHKSFHPVYNINVDVAKTDAKPQEIALAVMKQIEAKDKSMIRGLGA